MALHEALHLESLVLRFVPDVREGLRRGLVSGRLEDAAEQHRDVGERDAGALLDLREHPVGEVRVGTSEIEEELGRAHHHLSR